MTEEQIKTVVRHAVPEILVSLGMTPGTPDQMQRDMAFLRSLRCLCGSACTKVFLGLISAATLVLFAEEIRRLLS
jgi:hypothetical protein